jgi:hypothetical protein
MKHLLLNPHHLKKGNIPVHHMKKGNFHGNGVHKASTHHRTSTHHSSTAMSHKPTIKPLKFRF